MTTSAKQNIERAKGAAQERKAIAAEVRRLIKIYKFDLLLSNLLDWIKRRDAQC